jgi:hypothetical protein
MESTQLCEDNWLVTLLRNLTLIDLERTRIMIITLSGRAVMCQLVKNSDDRCGSFGSCKQTDLFYSLSFSVL